MKIPRLAIAAVLCIALLALFSSCDLLGSKRYSVVYERNDATAGAVPIDSVLRKNGERVTVLEGNTLTRIGYLFDSWNTAANGSGTAYKPNDTFLMGKANVQLFAQWAPHRTVTYLANGATGGTPPVDPTVYAEGASVTVLGPASLVREDSFFLNWNTAADGSGTAYDPNDVYTMGAAGVGMYAQWWQPTVHFDVGASAPAFPDARTTNLATIPAQKIAFPLALTADRTLYARWIDSTAGLAYTAVTGGYAVSKGTSANVSGTITIPTHWLGDPVVAIAEDGFMDHTLITGIIIPDSVTSIGAQAFLNCRVLVTADLPDGLTTLGVYAFAYCYNLNNITIPSGITVLGSRMFFTCYGLSNITLPDTMTMIDYMAFSYSGLVTIDLPDNLATIGYGAFSNCTKLIEIDIPATVTYIDDWAFRACSVLATVHSRRATPPQVRIGTLPMFEGCTPLAHIYVPTGSVAAYQTASGWSVYNGIIQVE
jgi:uncharacterized repeat protein (TIGR02543 family)